MCEEEIHLYKFPIEVGFFDFSQKFLLRKEGNVRVSMGRKQTQDYVKGNKKSGFIF